MSREEELRQELARLEAEKQKVEEQPKQVVEGKKVDPKVIELQFRQHLRLLKDKERQVSGNFKRNIMEVDPNRKDNSKTVNVLRNEIDEIYLNLRLLKNMMSPTKATEIEEEIKKEKDD
jgi:hypothetical protein